MEQEEISIALCLPVFGHILTLPPPRNAGRQADPVGLWHILSGDTQVESPAGYGRWVETLKAVNTGSSIFVKSQQIPMGHVLSAR